MQLANQIDAVAVIDSSDELHIFGSSQGRYPLASITKILTTLTVADVAQSGFIDLDEQFSLAKISFTDLLSHASGIRPNGEDPIEPRTKRIYTNEAYKRVEEELQFQLSAEFSDITINSLFEDGVKQQLGSTFIIGDDPAASATGTFDDLILLIKEMRSPIIIDPELSKKLSRVYLENLSGVVPGWGHFNKNTWGIGYEVHGEKIGHWMGRELSPQSFGHFGLSGGYVVHDPVKNISIAQIANQDFGPWAKDIWPQLNDNIVKTFS